MTQFQQWVPAAYFNSIAYLRRQDFRSGTVMPWLLGVVAFVAVTAVLLTHMLDERMTVARGGALSNVGVQLAPAQGETQAALAEKLERLAKVVDRLSTKFDESSQSAGAAHALHHELAALSKQTSNLKRELDSVSEHAMQVDTSISNIDASVSTPEVLSNKLERQKKSLNKP